MIILLTVLASCFFHTAQSAYCSGSPDPGERTNDYPIYDMKPRHIRSIKNAMLFEAGPLNASFPLVHVWGTPYEVGYAQGTLMKTTIKEFVYKTWGYLVTEIVDSMGDRLVFFTY